MIADRKIRNFVQSACESIWRIQEMLLDSAKSAIKSDETTAWHDAESLFQLAKEADILRKRLGSLLNDTCITPIDESAKYPIGSRRQSRTMTHTEKVATKKKKADYPRYLIGDNCLVKIGLRRDRRTEYKHIVQKAAFDRIASVIANHLTKGRDFTPESVQSDLNLPAYQTYVVLAMLRKMGLLKIPRRGLYMATDARDFVAAASTVWNKLPTSEVQKNDNN